MKINNAASVGAAVPVAVDGTAATAGTGTLSSRQDHLHALGPLVATLDAANKIIQDAQRLQLQNQAADPGLAGNLQRNAGNLMWHDGAAARRVTTDERAVRQAGQVTTEASTTSTTASDLLTISGISIAVATPFTVLVNVRSGANANPYLIGLKLNATQVIPNVEVLSLASESTVVQAIVGPRVANYLRSAWLTSLRNLTTVAGQKADTDAPAVAITSVIITGNVQIGGNSLSVNEAHVYVLPTAT